MVNDIVGELLDLDVQPGLESLWWTSTHVDEDVTMQVGFCFSRDGNHHGGVRFLGLPFPPGWEKYSRDQENASHRKGELVATWLHLSVEECTPGDEMSQACQS